jgi:hypothetical protein
MGLHSYTDDGMGERLVGEVIQLLKNMAASTFVAFAGLEPCVSCPAIQDSYSECEQ